MNDRTQRACILCSLNIRVLLHVLRIQLLALVVEVQVPSTKVVTVAKWLP